MKLFLLSLIFSLFIFNLVSAQGTLTGRIFENKTRVPLGGIKIENLKTHNTGVSDSTGRFTVSANTGDYIVFSGFAYRGDTVYVASLKYVEILLNPLPNMLKEVKVTNQEIKTGSLTAPVAPNPFGGETVRYQTDGAGNYIGGIKIMLFDSKSAENKRKRDHKIEVDDEKTLAIYNIFQPKSLQNYLPIKDTTEMDNFIILYTPDLKTYDSSSFNLTSYLNDCYQKFLKFPEDQRRSKTFLRLETKTN